MWVDERACRRSMVKAHLPELFTHVRHCRPVPERPSLEPELGRLTAAMLATLSRPRARQRGLRRLWRRAGAARPSSRSAAPSAGGDRRTLPTASAAPSPTPTSRCTTPMSWSPSTTASLTELADWLAREAPDDRRRRPRPAHGALQGGRPAREGGRALRPRRHGRHPRHRPHPHGDRVGGDHRRRASLLDRPRPVPRAQRLAVQPQQSPPRC